MLGETPLHLLANSTNPLAMWSARLIPGAPWIMLIPILASTAGGLWLTTYILTRALYAMGRERLIPPVFSRLNRRNVPHVAIIGSLGLALLVVALQVFVTSLGSFFNLILSAAGFFLLAEFFLDSVTATVFLTIGHRRMPEMNLNPHAHRWLRAGAIFSSIVMGALLVAFFIYGPRAIGDGIDQTIAILLVIGLAFAWWTKRRTTGTITFHGGDADREGNLLEPKQVDASVL
jgi:amino acid transporter